MFDDKVIADAIIAASMELSAAIDRYTVAMIEDRKIALGLGLQTAPQTPIQANVICLQCDNGRVKETAKFYCCDSCGAIWEKQPYKPPRASDDV
jgi:hypothetical protein